MATINPPSEEKAQSRLADALASFGEDGEAVEAVEKLASDAIKKAGQFVRENPVAAIGAGFGIGVLIGLLLRRD